MNVNAYDNCIILLDGRCNDILSNAIAIDMPVIVVQQGLGSPKKVAFSMLYK